MRRSNAARALALLARIGKAYGAGLGARKLALLADLEKAHLPAARQVLGLHELLCFLDAYPDDREVRARARRMLRAFRRRPDLRRHRSALAGTGIAGTNTPFRFFWPTARWICRHWPGALLIDREETDYARALLEALPQLLPPVQKELFRLAGKPTLDSFDRLCPRGMTDAEYFISLVAAMPGDEATREAFFDRIDPPLVLRAGPTTPERTTARFGGAPFRVQRTSLPGPRPDLRREGRRPPRRVTALAAERTRALIQLARISMATRERDAEIFQYADPRDAFLVDDGEGLAFAFVGMAPERRLLLPAVYGGLTLQNGVPIGYVQLDLLGRHAEISFNQFAAFRGGGSARAFARLVAVARHVFGCDSFSVEPYQLGHGNDEGIESGAWWFYHRFGFRPRAPDARRLAQREVRRARAHAGYRTPAGNLRQLARWHLFFSLDPARRSTLPRTARLIRSAARELQKFSQADAGDRRAAAAAAARAWLGAKRTPAGAERVLADWAGLLLALARTGRWSPRERRRLLRIIEAKAGPRERDYLELLQRHARLRRAFGC